MKQASRELRFAVLLELVDKLRAAGSWCGETHLQKSMFALEKLADTPLEYEFIMYKHGPFSFDLKDENVGLRAARLVELELQEGYGPRLKPAELSKLILARNRANLKKFDRAIQFVVEWFGKKDVKELEKLATALFVNLKNEHRSFTEKASLIMDLKPHISSNDADRALHVAQEKILESKRLGI